MNATDWIIDIALILIVFRQLREEKIGLKTVLLPLALLGWAASNYLSNIPTAGNDLVLIGVFVGAGVLFGLFGGLATKVRAANGNAYVKAGFVSAALWVISMSIRMGINVWSNTHSGSIHLASFSAAHSITSGQAWVAALILMAFGEVVVRISIIVIRGLLARSDSTNSPVLTGAY